MRKLKKTLKQIQESTRFKQKRNNEFMTDALWWNKLSWILGQDVVNFSNAHPEVFETPIPIYTKETICRELNNARKNKPSKKDSYHQRLAAINTGCHWVMGIIDFESKLCRIWDPYGQSKQLLQVQM